MNCTGSTTQHGFFLPFVLVLAGILSLSALALARRSQLSAHAQTLFRMHTQALILAESANRAAEQLLAAGATCHPPGLAPCIVVDRTRPDVACTEPIPQPRRICDRATGRGRQPDCRYVLLSDYRARARRQPNPHNPDAVWHPLS
jgi:hypothetical protein